MHRAILLLAVMAIFTSCQETIQGNGKVVEETREAAPFHSLNISGAFNVHIIPDNYSSIKVKADENLLEHIETYVNDGVLNIKSEANFDRYRALDLSITMDQFERLEASGACDIRNEGVLEGEKVKLDFSGAVESELSINAEELEGEFSGACEAMLKGNAERLEIETSGAVEINAEDFKTQSCRLDMSGAGKATVFVTQKLDIKVSGAAEVNYRGNPSEVKQDISGAANINKL